VTPVHWLTLLYGRSAPVALAVAQRILRDRQEAEDILQDTFVAALQLRGTYDPRRGTELSWLLAIIRTKALDRLRARRVRAVASVALRQVESETERERDPMAAAHVTDGFSTLPVHQQAALVLAARPRLLRGTHSRGDRSANGSAAGLGQDLAARGDCPAGPGTALA
jgi:RNA polymerase sigma factor (sigma-70 family)